MSYLKNCEEKRNLEKFMCVFVGVFYLENGEEDFCVFNMIDASMLVLLLSD
jgi:hypothetical protein